MISFDFAFNSAGPLHWIAAVLLAVFPVVVFVSLWKNTTLTSRRKWMRSGLNAIIWLVLMGYLLQPTWTTAINSRRALLVGAEVPNAIARKYQDSLDFKERFGAQEFLKKNLTANFDSVTLLGQNFTVDLLAQIGSGSVGWQPYFQDNQIQNMNWKSIVRQGEMQTISGIVKASEKRWARIKYAGETLDSVEVSAKQSSFALSFPTFTEGRSSAELFLGEEFLDTLRFFVRPRPVLSYQFILDAPDFESRTLAEWLGRKGNAVTVTTTVTKGIQQSTTINEGVEKGALPDVVITDAGNAGSAQIKKVLNAGKSVLFINTTQPEANLASINRALGTGFTAKRISSETAMQLAPGLTSSPYKFNEALPQVLASDYPVAIWNEMGKVGMSLLNETFPLKLSGDSVAYAKVWNTILTHVQPPLASIISADAPLFKGLTGQLRLNTKSDLSQQIRMGADTIALQPSPLSDHSATAEYLFSKAGWTSLGDSAEVFVEDSTSSLFLTRRMSDYIRAQRVARVSAVGANAQPQRREEVDDWVWLALFVVSCTALWIEPKL